MIQFVKDLSAELKTSYGRVATVGTFDGMHRGHRAVIDTVLKIASEQELDPMVFTFDRHPLETVWPERAPRLLMPLQDKIRILQNLGVKITVCKFDEDFKNITAGQWLARLKEEFDVRVLVAGYDNTFGSDGVMLSLHDYKKLGERQGILVEEAPIVPGVSSSAIRKLIEAGEIEKAFELSGRSFYIRGKVTEGNKLGRTIGFPTANLEVEPHLLIPGKGVYAAKIILPDGEEWPAMINIGTRPTVKRGEEMTIEAHIIDWNGNLYGETVILQPVMKIRDEHEFNTIEQLRSRLSQDREETLKILKESNII